MARPKTTAAEAAGQSTPELITPAAAPASQMPAAVPRLEKHIEAILRCFPCYETLYIDRSGGIYAPATPAALRGAAVLYTNPFYQSHNTNR
uniref:hypothetical protein n=1 Tax=Alistipes sp. D31t1_170403_E11 TaxID=2787128 RepID=UPI00189BAFB2|nr:hypothetical protein [Alistipes sp. D31t1_170403_E11]